MAARNEFSTVKKIILLQILVAILTVSGFFVSGGLDSVLSPALGSIVALLPACYFAFKIYRSRNQGAKIIVRAFYTGETVKIFLTAALFAMVFQIPNLNFLTLLVGYLAVLSVYMFALILWRD